MEPKKSKRRLHHCQLIVITRDYLKIKNNFSKQNLKCQYIPGLGKSVGKYFVVQNTLLSANCRVLNNKEKRYDILNYIQEARINIACLQDTHLVESMESVVKHDWDGDVYLNGSRSNARGVAILISKNFEF